MSASAAVVRAVDSSGVSSGMRTMTCNSLLLSNGSIFTVTAPSGTSSDAATRSTTMPTRNTIRRRGDRTSGTMTRR